MNCPGHILIFKQGVKSYRDLPLRYGEFGACHRNEPTGGLHGIMRVRGFTQDDGHIFCTEDQILAECTAFTTLLQRSMPTSASPTSSTRWPPGPSSASAPTRWDKAEHALIEACGLGLRVRDRAGRGRLLRPQDRIHAQGRHRPPVAVRHHAGRFLDAERLDAERGRGRRRHAPSCCTAPSSAAWSASSAS
jgi:threonyl-tRNA synthetase